MSSPVTNRAFVLDSVGCMPCREDGSCLGKCFTRLVWVACCSGFPLQSEVWVQQLMSKGGKSPGCCVIQRGTCESDHALGTTDSAELSLHCVKGAMHAAQSLLHIHIFSWWGALLKMSLPVQFYQWHFLISDWDLEKFFRLKLDFDEVFRWRDKKSKSICLMFWGTCVPNISEPSMTTFDHFPGESSVKWQEVQAKSDVIKLLVFPITNWNWSYGDIVA